MVSEHLFQHPHAALDRAGAVGEGCRRENSGHSQDSPAIAIAQLDLPHLGSSDSLFQAVDRGQCLVEKGVIAIDEIDGAPVLTDDTFEEQAGFVVHRPAHFGGHLRKHRRIKDLAFQAADAKPLRAKPVKQSAGATVLQHSLGLRFENLWRMQRPAIREGHQLVVGHGGPQQIRQTRSELVVVQRNDARARVEFSSRGNEEELGRNEDALEHQVKRLLVTEAVLPSQLERFHQDIQLRLGRRSAISLPRKGPGDISRRFSGA